MKIVQIYYSSHFARAFKKLPGEIQQKALEREKLFRENCFNPQLGTHKLQGSLKKYWSFSVTYSIRILFEFTAKGRVGFIDIDDHGVYRK